MTLFYERTSYKQKRTHKSRILIFYFKRKGKQNTNYIFGCSDVLNLKLNLGKYVEKI